LGRILIIVGVVIVVLGLVFIFGGRLSFLGKLPGDIVVKRDGVTVYFPIVTFLLISVILTLIINFILRSIGK